MKNTIRIRVILLNHVLMFNNLSDLLCKDSTVSRLLSPYSYLFAFQTGESVLFYLKSFERVQAVHT